MESHLIYPAWFPKDRVFPAHLFEPGTLVPAIPEKEWGDPATRPAKGYRYLHADARVNAPVPDVPCPVFGLYGDGIWYFGAYPASEDDLLYSPLKFSQSQLGAIYGAKALKAAFRVKVSLPTVTDKIETNVSAVGTGWTNGTDQEGTGMGVIWAVSTSGGDDHLGGLTPDPAGTLTIKAADLHAGYTWPSNVNLATQCWYSVGTLYDRYAYRDFEQNLTFSFARHHQTPAAAAASPIKWSSDLLGNDIFASSRLPEPNWLAMIGLMKPMIPSLMPMGGVGGGLWGVQTRCVIGLNPKPSDGDAITSDTSPTMNDDPADSGKCWTLTVNGISPDWTPPVGVGANTWMARWGMVGPEAILDTSLFNPRPPVGFPGHIRVPAGGTANWLRAASFMTQEQRDNYDGDPDSWSQIHAALGFNYQDMLNSINGIGEGVAYTCKVQLGGALGYGMMRYKGDVGGATPAFSYYYSNGYIDPDGNFRPMFKITLTASLQNPSRALNLTIPKEAAFFANTKFFTSDKHDIADADRVLAGTILAFGQEVKIWARASEAPGSISGTVEFDGFSESFGLFANQD